VTLSPTFARRLDQDARQAEVGISLSDVSDVVGVEGGLDDMH
jgi:hypothetical protein